MIGQVIKAISISVTFCVTLFGIIAFGYGIEWCDVPVIIGGLFTSLVGVYYCIMWLWEVFSGNIEHS